MRYKDILKTTGNATYVPYVFRALQWIKEL